MSIQHTPSTLDALQTRLVSSLKQSPPSYNDAISILSDLRESMSQIVHGPHYAHWLRTWIPILKDILTDVNVAVAKKGKAKDGKKDAKDVKLVKEKEKKPHALFVAPKFNGIRKCILDILTRCPLNDAFHGHAYVVLGCCVNVVLVDNEGKLLVCLGYYRSAALCYFLCLAIEILSDLQWKQVSYLLTALPSSIDIILLLSSYSYSLVLIFLDCLQL